MTSVFYDSAYKVSMSFASVRGVALACSCTAFVVCQVKAAWDTILESEAGTAVIDVQSWYVLSYATGTH